MKKSIRFLAFVLVLALSLPSLAFAAAPEELEPQESAFIFYRYAYVYCNNGTVNITFTVTATDYMTKLGASTIALYKNGSYVGTLGASAYPNMYGYNQITYSSTVSCPGEAGATYYAIVTFLATKSNGGLGYAYYTTEPDTM